MNNLTTKQLSEALKKSKPGNVAIYLEKTDEYIPVKSASLSGKDNDVLDEGNIILAIEH